MQEKNQVKEEAYKLIQSLPEDATWADFAKLVYEHEMIEEGIEDIESGRVWSSDEIRGKLGINK
jgi:hypothetical protein